MAESEAQQSDIGEGGGAPAEMEPPPAMWEEPAPSVVDAVLMGRDLRMLHKPAYRDPLRPVKPPPKPAKPVCIPCTAAASAAAASGSRVRGAGAKQRCRHVPRPVCSNRLANMSKPHRRHLLSMLQEHAHSLPPEKVQRLQDLFEGETHFLPDEAYDYFVFLRRANKKNDRQRRRKNLKKLQELCQDDKFTWARDATVVFARGVQKRLLKPASYNLTGGMLRLSDVVLEELCCEARMRTPARCDPRPKSCFMIDISDKIAVWIDQILTDSDDKMLLVDVDEDEDVLLAEAEGDDFDDDFLNMMGATYKKGPAFEILLKKMREQKDKQLYDFGGISRTYGAGADELHKSPDLKITCPNKELADEIRVLLAALVKPVTTPDIEQDMKGALEHCPKYLSQVAVDEAGGPEELARRKRAADEAARGDDDGSNYVKGAAFQLLVKKMKEEKTKQLYDFGGVKRTYVAAANELEKAPSMRAKTPNAELASRIRSSLTELVSAVTPPDLEQDMKDTLKYCPNYLSQVAVDEAGGPEELARRQREAEEAERGIILPGGPAFDLLVSKMKDEKGRELYNFGGVNRTYTEAAKELEMATNLKAATPNEELASKIRTSLSELVRKDTPPELETEMKAALENCPNYLSQRAVDEAGGPEELARRQREAEGGYKKGEAFDLLVENMRKQKGKELYDYGGVKRTYEGAASELENATFIKSTTPNAELAAKIRGSLTALVTPLTPANLQQEMKDTLEHCPNFLSQKAVDEAGGPEELARRQKLAEEAARVAKEREEAQKRIVAELKAAGKDKLYEAPAARAVLHTDTAGTWLSEPELKVDKSVRNAPETARLSVRFERNLQGFMQNKAPDTMNDPMQDAILLSSRALSEQFSMRRFYATVREITISEMQKRGEETLIEVAQATETYFFAAQRLKKTDEQPTATAPDISVSNFLRRKLEDKVKCRTPRKYVSIMKEYIHDASLFLSECVTKPHAEIEAYVALLRAMEAAGDEPLIDTNKFNMSYKAAAAHLRSLVSFEDDPSLPNVDLKRKLDAKLAKLTLETPPSSNQTTINAVINSTTSLLVSHAMLQEQNNDVLKTLVEQLTQAGDVCLLRHGDIRKTNREGAKLLEPRNAYELATSGADPVVSKKLELKLRSLLEDRKPTPLSRFELGLVKDASHFLAVRFLEPEIVRICKCEQSVQCEMWREQCKRRGEGGSSGAQPPARPTISFADSVVSQASSASGCNAPPYGRRNPTVEHLQVLGCRPTERGPLEPIYRVKQTVQRLHISSRSPSPNESTCTEEPSAVESLNSLHPRGLIDCIDSPNPPNSPTLPSVCSFLDENLMLRPTSSCTSDRVMRDTQSDFSQQTPERSENCVTNLLDLPFEEFASDRYPTEKEPCRNAKTSAHSCTAAPAAPAESSVDSQYWSLSPGTGALSPGVLDSCLDVTGPKDAAPLPWSDDELSDPTEAAPKPKVAVVSTDQMLEWSGVMMSLLWNVQSWRRWLQNIVERVTLLKDPKNETAKWEEFKMRIDREATQWRQYNKFSRQLAQKLVVRYKDKRIVSPTRATEKTSEYQACQKEMLHIVDMFEQWTHWLTDIVKETDTLRSADTPQKAQYQEALWSYFKNKIERNAEEWRKYNYHLKMRWEEKYQYFMAGMFPWWNVEAVGDAAAAAAARAHGVWVASAGGRVPDGARPAGLHRGERAWLARTTHRRAVLPAALVPSRGGCLLYAGGSTYTYTKYQVLCNSRARWTAVEEATAATQAQRAVPVARGVLAGRVRVGDSHLVGAVLPPGYRCHVAVRGRKKSFDCYEMLLVEEH